MKITKEKDELKSMDLQELAVRVEALRRELFGIKLSAAASHVKDYSRFKKLRASDCSCVDVCTNQKVISSI